MVSKRSQRESTAGGTAQKTTEGGGNAWTDSSMGYEQLREQRMKENKERMLKLGLFDISSKLKTSSKKIPRNPSSTSSLEKKTQNTISPSLPLSSSARRSTRLKTLTPVNYSEMPDKTKRKSSKNMEIQLKKGSQPEVYTEEDEKLLGDCKTPWTLCMDGYGEDGKRIYDPENGETCHQCRQKTLGLHTHCSKCELVQGQFCGDCLYMRYGENVTEVNDNPNWICPVCRGICNCSLCRKAKGWEPTGAIYRKVIGQGFKSVAHFLIQTLRSKTLLLESIAEGSEPKERALLSEDEMEEHETKMESSDTRNLLDTIGNNHAAKGDDEKDGRMEAA